MQMHNHAAHHGCEPFPFDVDHSRTRCDVSISEGGGSLSAACSLWLCHFTWEKYVLSARGFKRVGRHSEYAIYKRYGGA
jgi:hypothetical protein